MTYISCYGRGRGSVALYFQYAFPWSSYQDGIVDIGRRKHSLSGVNFTFGNKGKSTAAKSSECGRYCTVYIDLGARNRITYTASFSVVTEKLYIDNSDTLNKQILS